MSPFCILDGLRGEDGDDQLYAGNDHDWLFGDAGENWVYGGSGKDTIDGGSGHDDLFGDDGDDEIHGGPGNDILDGNEGIDFIDGGPQLDSPEIIDNGEPGYSDIATGDASWNTGDGGDPQVPDDGNPFEGIPYHGWHGQPGQPTPTYRYFQDPDGLHDGTATWKFDFSDAQPEGETDDVDGIRVEAYTTWVQPNSAENEGDNKTVDYYVSNDTGVNGVTGKVDDLDQGIIGPSIPLHDHVWYELPANIDPGPGYHSFTDNEWVEVDLEVESYSNTQRAVADASMLLPIWPNLDLATDSDNDGQLDPMPHGPDDRVEMGNPGRVIGVYDGAMPPDLAELAELEVRFSPNGYDEFAMGTELVLSWAGYEDLVDVWLPDEPGAPYLIRSTGYTWTGTAIDSDIEKTFYVEGLASGNVEFTLSLNDFASGRPTPDKVRFTVVGVSDFMVEERTWGDDWSISAQDEVLWASDEHGWTVFYELAAVRPAIQGVYWQIKPWEYRDDETYPWVTFASQSDDSPAIGS